MKTALSPELIEVNEAVHYRPAVSLIMPFHPDISLNTELMHSLKITADKIEHLLQRNYPDELVMRVMEKLRRIISELKPDPTKASLAIFVSPVFQKVLYLDIPVKEKLIIDESFEVRDLVYNSKQLQKFLLLLLSGSKSRLYLADNNIIVPLESGMTENIEAFVNETPERVANFSDMVERKQVVLDKFLQHIDNALADILKAHPFPLFVLGAHKTVGHFKKMTKHGDAIVKYIHGNFMEASLPELRETIQPHIQSWNEAKTKELLHQLDEAAGKKKLAVGIRDVWRAAINHRGRLLVVEQNYMYPARHGGDKEHIYQDNTGAYVSYIEDAVDDVIQQVLEDGGDIAFVNDNELKDYNHIALLEYY